MHFHEAPIVNTVYSNVSQPFFESFQIIFINSETINTSSYTERDFIYYFDMNNIVTLYKL